MRQPSWKVDLEVSVRLDGVVYHLRVRIFLGRRPDSKAEFAAGFEDTERFGAGPLGIGQVEKSEVGQDAIEGGIWEREILRIAVPKFNMRKLFLCDYDNSPGKIEAVRCCVAFGAAPAT